MKVPSAMFIFLVVTLQVSAQLTINPCRPSFSENTAIVPVLAFQSEDGFSRSSFTRDHVYAFNMLERFGVAPRFEVRLLSLIENVQQSSEEHVSFVRMPGLGTGAKYMFIKEGKGPSLSGLVQVFLNGENATTSIHALASKSLGHISFDVNLSSMLVNEAYEKTTFIVTSAYSFTRCNVFLESMVENSLNQKRPGVALQSGVTFRVHPLWQLDVAYAHSISLAFDYTIQTGVSFLVPFKK